MIRNLMLFFIASFVLVFIFFKQKNVKFLNAKKIGIIKETKNLNLKLTKNPINASIEDFEGGFILSYRMNEENFSYIGLSILDKNFNETFSKKIDVNSNFAEDPRIFKFQNEYFLIYNDKLNISHNCRTMHISKLNEKFDIEFKTNLDLHIKPIEKNWVPFNDGNNFMFAYGLVPHKIMMLKNFKKNDLHHLTFENNPCLSRFYWNFGDPRGGTPAKLVDDSYLAFFHSSFGKNKKKMNYVMGAYIFDKNPPYKIKKISNFPIFFESFDKTRIVFPAGFVIKKIYGKDYIYLSLGINDSSSKILVIDKEKLFSHMKDVN